MYVLESFFISTGKYNGKKIKSKIWRMRTYVYIIICCIYAMKWNTQIVLTHIRGFHTPRKERLTKKLHKNNGSKFVKRIFFIQCDDEINRVIPIWHYRFRSEGVERECASNTSIGYSICIKEWRVHYNMLILYKNMPHTIHSHISCKTQKFSFCPDLYLRDRKLGHSRNEIWNSWNGTNKTNAHKGAHSQHVLLRMIFI